MKKEKIKKTEAKSYYYWDVSGVEEDNPQKNRPYKILKRKKSAIKDE